MRWSLAFFVLTTPLLLGVGSADAQSLLDRLERTLNQPATPEPLPAPSSRTAPLAGRPTLGVTVQSVTDELARQRRLAVRRGALITAIVGGSPADEAGLPLGGVIVAVEGERIDSSRQMVEAVRGARTDRPVEIAYYDGARFFRKRVQLVPAAGEFDRPAEARPAGERDRGEGDRVLRIPSTDRRSIPRERLRDPRGARPLLGRVGDIIDGLVAPADAQAPSSTPPRQSDDLAALREQVAALQKQVALLQQRLAEVEKQLAAERQPDE